MGSSMGALLERACADAAPECAPAAPAGMPLGGRAPRGRVRWYPVWAPGRERATCERLRAALPAGLLADAFVLRREQWRKRRGAWECRVAPLWEGWLFAATPDAGALGRAMAGLSFPARLAGDGGRPAPLDPAAQAWYGRACDRGHVIRTSTGVIAGGGLRVLEGPLVGQEARVAKVDRHRCVCWVAVGEGPGAFLERAPLVVPSKG